MVASESGPTREINVMTQFGGAAGRILWGALSVRSMATGVVLGLALLVGNWVLVMADAEGATTLFSQAVIALALARFLVNGQFGEWQGTIFSSAGGPWSSVLLVALRYLALTSIWLLPLMFLGLRPEAALAPGLGGKNAIVLAMVYMMASILAPPFLLIVSAAAESFGEIFSPGHWGRLFGGRFDDMFSIYAVYSGGLLMAAVLAVPVVILGFVIGPKPGFALAGLAVCFLLGISINLLGRLCGFFTLGEIEPSPPATAHADGAGPDSSLQQGPTPPAFVPGVSARPGAAQLGAQQPAQPHEPGPTASDARKPPLLDAEKQVQSIMDRFDQHPPAAVSALEELRDAHDTNAHVLWGLCISQSRAGDSEGVRRQAGPAMQLCLERELPQLAADMYKELGTAAAHVELSPEQRLTVAGTLSNRGDLAAAASAYSTILCADPAEVRAVKGLLQVAESIQRVKSDPATAAKVYRFLLQRCPNSPLIEYAHRGLEEIERKLAQEQVPV